MLRPLEVFLGGLESAASLPRKEARPCLALAVNGFAYSPGRTLGQGQPSP